MDDMIYAFCLAVACDNGANFRGSTVVQEWTDALRACDTIPNFKRALEEMNEQEFEDLCIGEQSEAEAVRRKYNIPDEEDQTVSDLLGF